MSLEDLTDKSPLRIHSLRVLLETDDESTLEHPICKEKFSKESFPFNKKAHFGLTPPARNCEMETEENGGSLNSVLKISLDPVNEMEGNLRIQFLPESSIKEDEQFHQSSNKCDNSNSLSCLSLCSSQTEINKGETTNLSNLRDSKNNNAAIINNSTSTNTKRFMNFRDTYVQTVCDTRLFKSTATQTEYPANYFSEAEIQTDLTNIILFDSNDVTNDTESHAKQTDTLYDNLNPKYKTFWCLFENKPSKHFKTSTTQTKDSFTINAGQDTEFVNSGKTSVDNARDRNYQTTESDAIEKETMVRQSFSSKNKDKINLSNHNQKFIIAKAEKNRFDHEESWGFASLVSREKLLAEAGKSNWKRAEQLRIESLQITFPNDYDRRIEFQSTNIDYHENFKPRLHFESSSIKIEKGLCYPTENHSKKFETESANLDQCEYIKISSPIIPKYSSKMNRGQSLEIPVLTYNSLKTINYQKRPVCKIIYNPVEVLYFNSHSSITNKKTKVKKENFEKDHQVETLSKISPSINEVNSYMSTPLIFCRNQNLISGEMGSNMIPLCDPCFQRIQEILDEREKSGKSKQRSKNVILQNRNFRNRILRRKSCSFPEIDCLLPLEDREDMGKEPKDKESYKNYMINKLRLEGIEDCCKIVNNHLLNKSCCEKELKNSVNTLRIKWLKQVSDKSTNLQEVLFYLDYFKMFSENLLKMIVYATDLKGNNVLHFAFSNSRFDIANAFLAFKYINELLKMKNEAGHTPFMVCSISEPKTEMDWLVVYKIMPLVDVNEMSEYSNQTPLMNAACCGSDTMLQILLDAGADPNIQDADGSTALMYAAQHGQEKCVAQLLANPKCNLFVKDCDGETAYSIALLAGYKRIASLIHSQIKKMKKIF